MQEKTLSNLVSLICSGDFVSQEFVEQTLFNEYAFHLPIEEGVERFLCANDLVDGVGRLVDSRVALARMAQYAGENASYCSIKEEPETSTRKLLVALGIPVPPESRQLIGALSVGEELIEMRHEVEEVESSGRLRSRDRRGFAIDGWSYVEHVLKTTIGYYASCLTTEVDESVRRSFEHARQQHSLRPVLQSMRGIEKRFLPVPGKSADGGDAEFLSEQCVRLFGRSTPFHGFPFDSYDNDDVVNRCRNFYAHEVKEAIEAEGAEAVKDSLDVTIAMLRDLQEYNIAPSVLYVTTRGRDEYNRNQLWFVPEKYVHLPPRERREHEWRMYKRDADAFDPLQPCFCASPLRDGMFEPPMIPVTAIYEEVSHAE